MASKAPCATCGNKGAGIFRCEGCLQVFCRKHINEHRDLLSHQLDEIVLEHDTLQQTIAENKNKKNDDLPIVEEIDRWEKDSIRKIQQMADEARQQVKTLISSQKVSKELHDLTEQLKKARIDDDYVETDLRTWTTELKKLRDDVNMVCPSVTIYEDPSQVLVAKMYVNMKVQQSRQVQRFGESFGNVRIGDNGRLAIHGGPKNDNVLVREIGEYSSGTHKIRFLINKNEVKYITSFGVISKLMPVSMGVNRSVYSGYGWESDDDSISGDNVQGNKNFQDMKNQPTFEIELTLDCNNRKISYFNQRTKNRREINVNIDKCPFPWQVQFYLFSVGDSVRLLP